MPEMHASPWLTYSLGHMTETLDLALLATLQQLLTTRSVTETARRTGSTQPAVSRSLARLRARFGDPLLTRVGRRLEPTPFAHALAPRIDEALSALRRVLEPASPFDPAEDRGLLTIAASDYACAALLGPFFRALRQRAPGATTRVTAPGPGTLGELVRGDLHLALAPRVPIDGIEGLVMRLLTRDPFVCAMRRGHPAARGRLTLARYLALDHALVGNERTSTSAGQAALSRLGKTRRVTLVLPSFLAVAAHVAATDTVALLPSTLVASHAGLVARPVPFAIEPLALFLAWHPRWTTDARHRWMRETLLASIAAP